jgi:hypothetical protein
MEDIITPSLQASDIYQSNNSEASSFEPTPAGTYRMAVAGSLKVKTTKAGERKLEVFFKHVEPANKRLNGVSLSAMLEGTDKNGRPKAKQFGDLLSALGIDASDIVDGNASVKILEAAPSGEEWKGALASVTIRGDQVELNGREAVVKVEESTFNGKTSTKATAAYRAN